MPIAFQPAKSLMYHDVRFRNPWIKYCPFPLDYIPELPGASPRYTFRPYFSRKEVTILFVCSSPVNLRSLAFSRPVVAFSRMSFSQFLFLSFGQVYQINFVCVYISCSSSLFIFSHVRSQNFSLITYP